MEHITAQYAIKTKQNDRYMMERKLKTKNGYIEIEMKIEGALNLSWISGNQI